MRDVGFGWLLILVSFGIFAIGAALEIDKNGFSLHDSALVLELGLAFYTLGVLVGGWFAAPARP